MGKTKKIEKKFEKIEKNRKILKKNWGKRKKSKKKMKKKMKKSKNNWGKRRNSKNFEKIGKNENTRKNVISGRKTRIFSGPGMDSRSGVLKLDAIRLPGSFRYMFCFHSFFLRLCFRKQYFTFRD